MTRDQLRPLEGALVHVEGWVETSRNLADGSVAVCLRQVKLRRWDGEAPIGTSPITAAVDHLWLHGLPPSQRRERLWVGECIGRVGWYRRGDGSVDLGVEQVPADCVDRLYDWMLHHRNDPVESDPVRLTTLRAWLDYFDQGVVMFSWFVPTSEAVTLFRTCLEQLQAVYDLNMRTRATATNRGPCRGLDAGLPVGKRRLRADPARGFA
jgi:hypothetical protein